MSSCSCACDYPGLFIVLERTAKKDHICCECGSGIFPGEKYESHEGKWQGNFKRFKLCSFCAEALKDLWSHKDFDCDCLAYGDLWDYEELISEQRRWKPS